jgi:hypothetical protein
MWQPLAELDGGRAIDTFLNRVSGDPIENPLSVDEFERASLAPALAQFALVNAFRRSLVRIRGRYGSGSAGPSCILRNWD